MEEIFEFEGQEYTLSEVQSAAEAKSLSVDDYTKQYNVSRKSGKEQPTPQQGAETVDVAQAPSMDLPSVNSLSEYPGAKSDFINAIADPEISTKDALINRYFIGTADPMEGAKLIEQSKANKEKIAILKRNFDKGKFKLSEKELYQKYKETGEIQEKDISDAYIRPINPETLEQYTGIEMLENVAKNFFPGWEAQIQSIGAYGLDWIEKAAGKDAADFLAGRIDLNEKIVKKDDKYFYEKDGEISGSIGETSNQVKEQFFDRYIELQNSMDYAGSITKGFKEGDIVTSIAGIANATSGAAQTMIPAMLTKGASLYPVMIGSAYMDFNIENAKRLYKDDPDAIKKAIEAGQTEVSVPTATGAIGGVLERIGFKKVSDAINSNKGLSGFLTKTIWAFGTEGATGYGQFITEDVNKNLGKGMDLPKALDETSKVLFSEDALEATLQEAFGGLGFSVVGKSLKSLRSIRANTYPDFEKDVNALSELKIKLATTKDDEVAEGIKNSISEIEEKIKNSTIAANGIFLQSTDEDLSKLNNIQDIKDSHLKKVRNLIAKRDKGDITPEEYDVAYEGYKKAFISAKNRVAEVVENISNKSSEAAQKVQKIYEEKGIEGANEIIEAYKPLVTRLTNKYKDVPGFDFELLKSEIEIGNRGLLDLIKAYDESKGATLNTYVQGQLANRSIEAANRILDTEFTLDVTEAKGVTDTTTEEATEQVEAPKEVQKLLSDQLKLSDETSSRVIEAVEKTLGTRLPAVEDKNFNKELKKNFRNELVNVFKQEAGKGANYNKFVSDVYDKLLPLIPQETLNRKLPFAVEPVLDPDTGKQKREKTKEGKKIFKRKDVPKAEFIKYFTDTELKGNVKGARKTSLAEILADEIGMDKVLPVLSKPAVLEKFMQVQELQGQKVPDNLFEMLSLKIDRGIEKLEAYQKSGNMQSSTGIPEIIINSTIVFAKTLRAGLKAGKAFVDALNDAIDKFRKSLGKKYSEEELDAAEDVIRTEVTEDTTPDFLDLASIIEDVVAGKRGEAYENEILKALKQSDATGLKVISTEAKGSDATGEGDITVEYNNQKMNIEVKLNANAQYSSIAMRMDGSLTNNTSFDNILLKLAKEKQDAIEAYKSRAVELGGDITNSAIKVSKDIHNKLKEEGLQRELSGDIEVSADIIAELYNKKNVYYIQVGEAGLFHLGKDILNLGTPKFSGVSNVTMRIRRSGNSNTITFFPKLSKWKQTSTKTLDTLDGINDVFTKKKPKDLNTQFNRLIEATTGVEYYKTFSPAKARLIGKGKGKRKFFIPYSADDLVGLLYTTLGKGKTGDKQMAWYEENLIRPFSRGIQKYEAAKQKALREWMDLKKQVKKDVPGGLNKANETGFTNQNSVRMYIWAKQGMEIPGAAQKDISDNVKIVNDNPALKSFAERLIALNPEGYPKPGNSWDAGDITTDLVSYINDVRRAEFLTQWNENVKEIFSDTNKEKLRALYGDNYIEALEDMLHRMKTGRNRKFGVSKVERQFMDWTNNSVGAIMFFNARSAVLQTLSAVNFINFSDNNPINAGIAFANQKQYWRDFSTLFNSDFLKQRRTGLQTDVNADEIANAAAGSANKAKAALSAILKLGFTPTQVADSFAIASGGATMYRNRIKKYLKQGLDQEAAEKRAFTDFQEIAEETQQSARPDRISMQQASSLGRLILAFGNTPMQYARLTKKASLDLINGRGDWKTNISKIAYYSVIQNIIFSALQQGLFALLFDEEDEDKEKSRLFRIGNSSIDTLLRGSGVYGAAAATVKNMIMEIIEQSKKSRPDYTQVAMEATSISPPINSKLRKLESAGKTFTYKQSKEKVFTEGFSLENPAFLAAGKVISAGTNLPADRVVQKADHIYTAMQPETELWQAIALSLGWSEWDLGMIEKQTKKASKPRTSRRRSRPTRQRNQRR